ncbi:MAG: DNA repair protein RadC [Bacteroidaceae bacterium]|nr:DNA repair protein RadC [Bacteroidaceae bacterium]
MQTPASDKERLTVKQWDEQDRPREKLLAQGAQALSDAELLAILIGSGTPEETAVDVTRRILDTADGSLRRLGRLTCQELCAHNGIGPAKAVTIMAACELGRRREAEHEDRRPLMNDAAVVWRHFKGKLADSLVEEFHIALLDNSLRLITTRLISRGGLTSTAVDLRVLLREALTGGAAAIAAVHNHPSGNPKPSHQDDDLTSRIKAACQATGLHFVDHIIVTPDTYYSYCESGRI